MKKSNKPLTSRRFALWLLLLATAFMALVILTQLSAHMRPYFTPSYPQVSLDELQLKQVWDKGDYDLIYAQTGLGQKGVDYYRTHDMWEMVEDAQESFFRPTEEGCDPLGFLTREDHGKNEAGEVQLNFGQVPLEAGDVLISFSTHTMGWRHGHGGLVLADGTVLEAALIGADSYATSPQHWRTYSTYLHLRLRDISPQTQSDISAFALEHLDGMPYRLTSGVFGKKAPDPAGGVGAQCAYLVWYALQAFGYDVDSDGGRIVTVLDLAESPLFEVVQIYGLSPDEFPLK